MEDQEFVRGTNLTGDELVARIASFSKMKEKLIKTNDTYSGLSTDYFFRPKDKGYTLEEVNRIVESGSLEEKQKLSNTYFRTHTLYARLIIHYATILKYQGILVPHKDRNSTGALKKKYQEAINLLEKIEVSKICTHFATKVLLNGTYFGLIQSLTRSSFSFVDLPNEYCRSRYKDQEGNDIIEFNLTYFNSILNKEERRATLDLFPKEIKKAYNALGTKRGQLWFVVPSSVGICFPFFNRSPIFLSTIEAIANYDGYLELERNKDTEEIKKILVQKIPISTNGEFFLQPEEAEELHVGAVGMMKNNRNISVLTTYADVKMEGSEAYSEARGRSNLDKVLKSIFDEAGASPQLFASTGNIALEKSVQNDLAMMMSLAKFFEKFITNLINQVFSNPSISFKYTILPISYYNEKEFISSSKELATLGYSFLLPAIAQGLSQRDLEDIKFLENDILKLGESLIPLSSSYTDSGDAGRPEKETDEKDDRTLENEESGGGGESSGS